MKNLGYGLTQEHLKKTLRSTYAKLSISVVSAVWDPQFWIRKLPVTPADFPRNFAPQITCYNIRTSAFYSRPYPVRSLHRVIRYWRFSLRLDCSFGPPRNCSLITKRVSRRQRLYVCPSGYFELEFWGLFIMSRGHSLPGLKVKVIGQRQKSMQRRSPAILRAHDRQHDMGK